MQLVIIIGNHCWRCNRHCPCHCAVQLMCVCVCANAYKTISWSEIRSLFQTRFIINRFFILYLEIPLLSSNHFVDIWFIFGWAGNVCQINELTEMSVIFQWKLIYYRRKPEKCQLTDTPTVVVVVRFFLNLWRTLFMRNKLLSFCSFYLFFCFCFLFRLWDRQQQQKKYK